MTPAPCAGFVWFRWVRPRTWHRWESRTVVFDLIKDRALILPTVPLLAGDYAQTINNFLGPNHIYGFVTMRKTHSECTRCFALGKVI